MQARKAPHGREIPAVWQCVGEADVGGKTMHWRNATERTHGCFASLTKCLFQEIIKLFCFLTGVLVPCMCSVLKTHPLYGMFTF